MSKISIHRNELLRITHGRSSRIYRQRFRRTIPPWRMTINSKSSDTSNTEELSVKISNSPTMVPQVDQVRPEGLRFDRLQPTEPEFVQEDRLEFGKFVAREAILDEEFWTAAWLRAESHWEDRASERYVDNYKRKFAEQEFNAIKRRCKGMQGQQCSCIVAVKKEEKHIKRSVIKSVVGTLDLSIRFFLQGETFPGEKELNKCMFMYIEAIQLLRNYTRRPVSRLLKQDNLTHQMIHICFSTQDNSQQTILVLSLLSLFYVLENGREESRRRRLIDGYISWLTC